MARRLEAIKKSAAANPSPIPQRSPLRLRLFPHASIRKSPERRNCMAHFGLHQMLLIELQSTAASRVSGNFFQEFLFEYHKKFPL
jgi:hypothetical protein